MMLDFRSTWWFGRLSLAVFLGFLVSGCASLPNRLDESLSLDLSRADVREVLSSLATSAGLEPVLDPDLGGDVSLSLQEVSVRAALDEVCKLAACTWEVKGAGAILSVQRAERVPINGSERRFDLVIDEGVALDVLQPLADVLEAELVLEPALAEKLVTLDLTSATASEVLDEVCRQLVCRWRVDTEENVARLFVVSAR